LNGDGKGRERKGRVEWREGEGRHKAMLSYLKKEGLETAYSALLKETKVTAPSPAEVEEKQLEKKWVVVAKLQLKVGRRDRGEREEGMRDKERERTQG